MINNVCRGMPAKEKKTEKRKQKWLNKKADKINRVAQQTFEKTLDTLEADTVILFTYGHPYTPTAFFLLRSHF